MAYLAKGIRRALLDVRLGPTPADRPRRAHLAQRRRPPTVERGLELSMTSTASRATRQALAIEESPTPAPPPQLAMSSTVLPMSTQVDPFPVSLLPLEVLKAS
jgi:hypothetical protein